jgi:poly(3-hydroxybutyrate) depolymerase
MGFRRLSVAFAAAALISAAAGAAVAGEKADKAAVRPMDFVVRSDPAVPNAGQTLKLDTGKGRFGLTLNVQQFQDRPAVANDVQAGAYFRITPSLRVGGSVAFGEQQLTPRPNSARPADAPKVRLESTFKF